MVMKGQVVGKKTTNVVKKKHGSTAEHYPARDGAQVPLPTRDSGGFSPGTRHRMNDVQAVPGNAHQGLSESGTEAD